MTSPVPSDDEKHRRMFLVALSEFSNHCEPPDLTPACPFFQVTATGPQCAEECLDVLAEHNAVDIGTPVDGLFGDYAFRRARRPRRDLTTASKVPFDAAQVEIEDEDKVTSSKRTVALVRTLRKMLLLPPEQSDDEDDRRYQINASWDELNRRGFPTDYFVRDSLSLHLALIALTSAELESEQIAPSSRVTAWRELIEAANQNAANGSEGGLPWTAETLFAVARAMSAASREDIVELRAPGAFPTDDGIAWQSPKKIVKAMWLHDRFAETYVSDWQPTSRALEWQYLHGHASGCCPPHLMKERYVAPDELGRYLSPLGAQKILDSVEEVESPRMRTGDFTRIAAEHLRGGQYETAATLFRAIAKLRPTDADAANNLAFCLIPVDVAEAWQFLERASELAPDFDPTRAANRVLVLHLLGRDEEAVREADEALTRCSADDVHAFLWKHEAQAPLQFGATAIASAPYISDLRHHILTGQCDSPVTT